MAFIKTTLKISSKEKNEKFTIGKLESENARRNIRVERITNTGKKHVSWILKQKTRETLATFSE